MVLAGESPNIQSYTVYIPSVYDHFGDQIIIWPENNIFINSWRPLRTDVEVIN